MLSLPEHETWVKLNLGKHGNTVTYREVLGDLQALQPCLLLGWSSRANVGLACEEQTLGRTLALA